RSTGGGGQAMSKGNTGAAAGGGALYGLGIFGALFYYWQQADSFWEYVWAIFPKAIFWPAYLVYEGFIELGAGRRKVKRRSGSRERLSDSPQCTQLDSRPEID